MANLEDYLTVPAAASLKLVTPQAIRLAIAQGRLVAVKVGRSWLIHKADLALYVPDYAQQRRTPCSNQSSR